MAVRGNASDIAKRWATRTAGASQQYQEGIQRVTDAPGQKAAAQRTKWRQNVAQAEDKWAANTASVTVDSWKQSALTKGAPRFADGATKAQPKMEGFLREVIPHIEAGQRTIDAMPSTTLEDNINRASAWMRHMAQFKRSGSR